jgi:hypothetical protein
MVMRIWPWLVVAGCWRDPVTPADPPVATKPHAIDTAPRSAFEDIVIRFEGIVDEMCDCHDRTCADHVTADLSSWANDMSKDTSLTPTRAESDRMTALSQRYGQCVNAAMGSPPP